MTRDSLLLIDKPRGISSNTALRQIKKKLDINRKQVTKTALINEAIRNKIRLGL